MGPQPIDGNQLPLIVGTINDPSVITTKQSPLTTPHQTCACKANRNHKNKCGKILDIVWVGLSFMWQTGLGQNMQCTGPFGDGCTVMCTACHNMAGRDHVQLLARCPVAVKRCPFSSPVFVAIAPCLHPNTSSCGSRHTYK